MHPKLSQWLSKSTAILQDRINRSKSETTSLYVEELNIRRELVSNTKELDLGLSASEIVGHYHVIGANSSNSNAGYMGILSLVEFENRIQATWQMEGNDTQTGFGLLLNNTLSLNFNYTVEGKEYSGLVSYDFISPQIISGIWVEEGSDEIGVEFGRRIPVGKQQSVSVFWTELMSLC